jgi:hypothetical protein
VGARATCAVGVAAVLLVVASCSSGTSGSASPPSSSAPTTTAATPAGSAAPAIVDAANAVLATLDTAQTDTVLFDWTDTEQKQRWSNFPPVAFARAGLMWGELSQPSRTLGWRS